jgi:hypothetical protein
MNDVAPRATNISLASRDHSTVRLHFKLNKTPAAFPSEPPLLEAISLGRILVRSHPIRSDEPDAIHRRIPSPPRRRLLAHLRLRVRSQGTQPFPSYTTVSIRFRSMLSTE